MSAAEEPRAERPSKSQRKREMHALQDLGERLVAIPGERLARIELPEALREAVLEARRITKHEARRRQMQYIGRLMRDLDPAPIREALAVLDGTSAAETARQHRLERLRSEFMADEAALQDIIAHYPAADPQRLRSLRRNALKEQEQGRPPRSFRELFRALRELDAPGAAEHATAEEGGTEDE